MKHIEYYEADDGTRFEDKWDCEVYEDSKAFASIDEYLKIFDEDLNPIEVGAINDETWQVNATYFIIYNDKGYEYLRKCEDWTGIKILTKPNRDIHYPVFYQYDSHNYCGIDVVEQYNEAKRIYNTLKEAM